MRTLTPARVTVLMLLVVGGLVAAYVAKSLLAANDDGPGGGKSRAVPMAVADLKPGTIVTEAHLGLGRMPIRQLAEHPGMLLENRAIVGRVVKNAIPSGTPIISTDLYEPGEIPPLQVAAGMRAVSVPLNSPVALVDGRIGAGQFVDVHMTVTESPRANGGDRFRGGVTLTLFKGVRLLAINSTTSQTLGGGTGSSSVTLELTPGQANIMILAAKRGEITLSYNPEGRGNGGVGVNSEDRATLDEILGMKPIDGSFHAEVYKGSGRSTLQFRNGRRVNDGGLTRKDDPPSNNPDTNTADERNKPQTDKPKTRPAVASGPSFGPVK